ncbi:MAG: aminopeptidase P family protein [Tumebacillaceae bacterium]
MNREFFKNNRQKLSAGLPDASITLLFAGTPVHRSADQNYEFTPNRNFYYMTGISKPHIILMITKMGEKVEETLFIQKADPVMEKWEGKTLDAEGAKSLSGVANIAYLDDFVTRIGRMNLIADYKTVCLDMERRSPTAPLTAALAFAKEVQDKYPHLKIENVYHNIDAMRRFKAEEEIADMRRAIEITNKGIQNMMKNARPGITENELEAHFDFTLKVEGAKEHAFHSIVAGGQNATILHYEDNNQVVEDGALVLIDLGAAYGHYSADISRTFPINGKFTERQKEVYNLVLQAELEVIKNIKPGVPAARLNEIAKEVLAAGCKKLGLITEDSELINFYYHGVSHYLGLDTHDVGAFREETLQPGMVVTVEPGLYIEGEAIGIRIEDDVLVTEDGCEVLSKDIIKTVEEIEAFMAK